MKIQSLFVGVALALVGAGGAQAELSFSTVRGRIVDAQGNPIMGALVTLEGVSNPKVKPWTMETTKKGIFTNDRVLPGSYKITFAKEGLATSGGAIDVLKNEPKELGDIKLVPAAPDHGSVLVQADNFVKDGKFDEAVAAYKELIAKLGDKLPPADMAKLDFDLGLVYEKKKDWENAELYYKKALEADPTLINAYGGLGNVYQAQNRPDDAVKLFQAAAAAQPDNGRLAYDLGLFLWKKGKNAEAYDSLQKAAALLPDNPEVQYHLGVAAIGLNKADEAVKYLEKYLAMSPTNQENIDSAKVLIPAIKSTAAANKK
jgi:Tfp pilus assembly protein PilF